jgi:hypothetical protein
MADPSLLADLRNAIANVPDLREAYVVTRRRTVGSGTEEFGRRYRLRRRPVAQSKASSRATLDTTIAEAEAAGARFFAPQQDGTWSEAGPIEVAPMCLPSGERVLLVTHVTEPHFAAPEIGIEIRATSDADCGRLAKDVAAALEIATSRITWVRPIGWPDHVE